MTFTNSPPGDAAVRSAGKQRLHVELTDLQAQAARGVLDGRDTLLISPTGSGKSAVTAAWREGLGPRPFGAAEPIVVVATSAFGLGSMHHISGFVVHLEAPETIDASYHEIGRAGRDGAPADAVLHHVIGARVGGASRVAVHNRRSASAQPLPA